MTQYGIDEVSGLLQAHKGYSYCVVMKSEMQKQALLTSLLQWRAAAVVSSDGSLISGLTGAENIVLPVRYLSMKSDSLVYGTTSLFSSCELIDERELKALLAKFPEQMSLYEKRMVGFMRAMCVEPELMIYDGIYEGLARHEVEQVGKFDDCFHLHFPFRTSVLLCFENFNHPTGSQPKMIYLDDEIR
ncbi:MAG: hypothetical protein PHP85_04680 [Gallionella sp.]|nr:hypothetical protein [Gallionella sp.]